MHFKHLEWWGENDKSLLITPFCRIVIRNANFLLDNCTLSKASKRSGSASRILNNAQRNDPKFNVKRANMKNFRRFE
jgi:hypothetical protein